MTPAFFYLLGQNVTFLSVSWLQGLVFSALLALGFVFSDYFFWLFVGWFSCLPLVLADTAHYSVSLHPDHDYSIATHFFEWLMFIVFTWIVSVYDQFPLLWALQLTIHGCYVLCVHKINTHSGRISHHKKWENHYHFYYACMLIGSDAVFLATSAAIDHVSELAVFLVAVLTACSTHLFIGIKKRRLLR